MERPGFTLSYETPEKIEAMIRGLNPKVATGYDEIPSRILKDLVEVVTPDLTKLVNLSYETSTFPQAMKHAWIKCIFKEKGTHNQPEFYRPISILSVISKLFEKSATSQIVGYLESNNGLYSGQHAYRKWHYTTTCLIEITEAIHQQLENSRSIGIASMDLSKAFDSVSHNLLLRKLEKKGFSGKSIKWLQTYLSNRTQEVRFTDHKSGKTEVQAGVPQGSVLGPILFIALTSDLVEHLKDCVVKAYADDTQLIVTGKTTQEVKEKLETSIRHAQDWFRANSLQINPSKTEIMILGGDKNRDRLKIQVNEGEEIVSIETVHQIKVLGVILDEEMNWKSHIKSIKRKASYALRNLARTGKSLLSKTKRLLYDALVAPHLSYADVVWDGCRQEQQKELQRLHNFAVRIISGTRKHDSASKAMRELGMIPLSEKRQVHQAVMAHKLINGKGPLELCNRFKGIRKSDLDLDKLENRLRSKRKMNIQPVQHRTARFERSTIYRATKAWNRTDPITRTLEDGSKFKILT